MHKKTILYRGNLKSCNYNCSYCPFSKHKPLRSELERDRQNFIRFCDSVEKRVTKLSIGAVFVTPYGEASLYRWYWEGLARLSGLSEMDQVGIQTNLSFPFALPERKTERFRENAMENCLHLFDDFGGKREKLCIWATFHPEMTDMDTFVSKCHQLAQQNIRLCAGSVGVPENIRLLRELRKKLSKNIYFWINKMDGMRRNYTAEEVKAFSEIDPFFAYELSNPAADATMCQDRCFVEADGNIRTCNISKGRTMNWYNCSESELFLSYCSQKRCTCYLAYGGREDFALKNIFGNYPVFRIPKRFQAIFFDLDGTLLEEGSRKGLSEPIFEKLKELQSVCPIFFATSMPEVDAKKRLKGDIELFSGGIFASGAYLYVKGDVLMSYGKNKESGLRDTLIPCGKTKDMVYSVESYNASEIMQFAKEMKARVQIYRKYGMVYKVTLIKRQYGVWSNEECSRAEALLQTSNCRFFTEKNCLEIIHRKRDKGVAIKELCEWLSISLEDVLAVGNDREDAAMKRVCGAYIHKR